MKWTKASERLPELDKDLCLRWNGEQYGSGRFYKHYSSIECDFARRGTYREPSFALIEWLDESATEELKEGGGMSSDQAVMAFAHHMNKQRGYETVHGTMYYNDADSDKPLTAVGIAEQWIQSQTGEQFKEG